MSHQNADMIQSVSVGDREIGPGNECYIIAEIGINHNGDMDVARKLVNIAVDAGCNAVKFQKRTPELCVPLEQRNLMRETPWGYISYMEYRNKVEFGYAEYQEIDEYCREKGIHWFASCWDIESLELIERLNPVCHKVSSAAVTDHELISAISATGKPVIVSTGMSTIEEIDAAVDLVPDDTLLLAHCTSTYPCPVEQLNLRIIGTLRDRYGCVVGYSGHEVGLQTTTVAVGLGAYFVERHITIDRTMWRSDQSSSIEPHGLAKMVNAIRAIELAMGDGIKQVYDSERQAISRLRMPAMRKKVKAV